MPIRQRVERREPTNYYGLVEEVIEADPENAHTRSFLLIDAVRADHFDNSGPQVLEDPSALALIRAMSPPKRWQDEFSLGPVAKGDWLFLRLDDRGGIPRAWELRADNDYLAGPSRSIASVRRLSGDSFAPPPDDLKLVMNLVQTTNLPPQLAARASAADALEKLGPPEQVEIVVLDVGQASAALIKRNGKPIGFFDIGAPIWFNRGSLPRRKVPTLTSAGFVILSHWNFDHFDLGRRHQPYRNLAWFAPDQPVGPNTARFQADLGDRLTFIDGPGSWDGFRLERGTGSDRNGSGYQLRYEKDGYAVLLTGDARYGSIQPHMLTGIGGLTIPHHAGHSDDDPPVAVAPRRAIASFGVPNSYRHSHPATMLAHDVQG